MNRIISTLILALTLFAAIGTAETATKREKLTTTIINSEYVLEEIMTRPDLAIPASILQEAKALIITINYRGSFFFGAQGGSGVILAKNPATGDWAVPGFVTSGGANFGLQFGIKEMDTIYVIMDDQTLRKAVTGRFDLAADAAAVIGPKGRHVVANEDSDYQNANILVYSTAKGLFAGVAVKAGWLAPDTKANKHFYQTEYKTPEIIFSDWFQKPAEAKALFQRVNYYKDGGR